jgi:hypothetical protein
MKGKSNSRSNSNNSNSQTKRKKLYNALLADELPRPWKNSQSSYKVPYPKHVSHNYTKKRHSKPKHKPKSKSSVMKKTFRKKNTSSSHGYGQYVDIDSPF